MTPPIRCADGCGVEFQPSPDALEPPGWTHLPITNRWRCPTCARVLAAINQPPARE